MVWQQCLNPWSLSKPKPDLIIIIFPLLATVMRRIVPRNAPEEPTPKATEEGPLVPGRWASFTPKLEVLPPAQSALWPRLGEAAKMGFVLYGGTAITLRLGHRESVDFDFFTEKPFDHDEIFVRLPFLKQALVTQEEVNTLSLTIEAKAPGENEAKLSFFTVKDMGRIGVPEWSDDGCVLTASLEDLLALKLKVILDRVEKKDYLDIAALLQHGLALEKGLAGARAFYGRRFQPSEALKALAYFKGGNLHELPKGVQKALAQAVAKVDHLPPVPEVSLGLGGNE